MKALGVALALSLALVAGSAEAQTSPPPYPPPAYAPPPPPAYPPPPPPAYQPYPPPSYLSPTAHRHLGFALRLDGGFGYTTSSAGGGSSMDGASGLFGIVLGGAVSENLILGGELWATGVSSPSSSGTFSAITTFAVGGVGVNLTYYVMPANVYLSASPSITTMSVDLGGTHINTDAGFGMKLAVGKEWWVGDHWGIGLAGQFLFSANKEKIPSPPTWNTVAAGVAFSATFN